MQLQLLEDLLTVYYFILFIHFFFLNLTLTDIRSSSGFKTRLILNIWPNEQSACVNSSSLIE